MNWRVLELKQSISRTQEWYWYLRTTLKEKDEKPFTKIYFSLKKEIIKKKHGNNWRGGLRGSSFSKILEYVGLPVHWKNKKLERGEEDRID